jgi:hypothetical protein
MKAVLIISIITGLLAFTAKDKLTGRWETTPDENGVITGILFKPDNIFDMYVNKKPFASGTYILDDNVISFVDNGCAETKGIYKIIFFSNSDSMRWEPIQDSCTGRRVGIPKLVLGRVK